MMWMNYIKKLFRGVNYTLKQLKTPVDIVFLQKCKVQYTILCGLIEDVNKHYRIIIAYYLICMTSDLFTTGFSMFKTLSSGSEFRIEDFLMLLLQVVMTVLLFYFSFGLKSEVS